MTADDTLLPSDIPISGGSAPEPGGDVGPIKPVEAVSPAEPVIPVTASSILGHGRCHTIDRGESRRMRGASPRGQRTLVQLASRGRQSEKARRVLLQHAVEVTIRDTLPP